MTKPTKKLFFINRFYAPDISATAQLLTDVAEGLATEAKWSINVISSQLSYNGHSAPYPKREVIRSVNVIRIWSTRFGRKHILGRALDYLTFYLSIMWHVFRYAEAKDIFIVKTDPPLLMVLIGPILRLKKSITVNWLQDIYPEIAAESGLTLAQGPLGTLIRSLRNKSLEKSDATIAISHGMKSFLLKERPKLKNITIIENFSDTRAITPIDTTENSLRQKWGFQDNDFIIGYSGNLGRAHDIDTMLNAANSLQHRPDIKFLFIGGGFLHASISEQIVTKKLKNITLKPYQPRDQLRLSLGVSDIHWLSLRPAFEGLIFPSKFYGIAAAGRPMIFIGDAEGDIGCLCSSHTLGYSVSPGDVTRLVKLIEKLSATPQELKVLGQNSRSLIENQFKKDDTLLKWHAFADSTL